MKAEPVKEFPSKFGYTAYLFEELASYDEALIASKSREWLRNLFKEFEGAYEKGNFMSLDEFKLKMEEKRLRLENRISCEE